MSDHQHATTYVPKSAFAKWFESRLPIAGLIHSSFVAFPVPRNLNYFWTFGAVLFFMLVLQIVTGVILAMHYQPSATAAFDSLEHIMRDVNYGWLLRYLHANGASMFFVAVYIHIFRNLYYGSYKAPREILYILGVIIYGLMMATAFLGYTLPWGQMSFWGATVITNILAAIPVVGDTIQSLLWGGYSVGNPTLNRFFSLHYLLPFMIVGVVILHVWALHVPGNNNPAGIELKSGRDAVPFHPYMTVKDGFSLVAFLIFFAWWVFYMPNYLGHADNYIPANPAVTPAHIVPGMVLPALLRHPARDPGQARRRHRHVRLDHRARARALARHLEGALGGVPADLQAVLLGLGLRLLPPRLARRKAPGGRLRDRGADRHRLLLRAFPGADAAARHLRAAAAAAGLDRRQRARPGRLAPAGRSGGGAAGEGLTGR